MEKMEMTEQIRRTRGVWIYLDMDGVLADFDRGVNELCGLRASSQDGKDNDPGYDDRMWEAIRKVDHFYGRLKLMPGAKEMFDLLYGKYGDRCEILTGIPKPKRGIAEAGEDKTAWVKRLLSDRIRVNIVYREEKPRFCRGRESVLIDDREGNIREWEEMGGTGILHVSAEKTLAELKRAKLL